MKANLKILAKNSHRGPSFKHIEINLKKNTALKPERPDKWIIIFLSYSQNKSRGQAYINIYPLSEILRAQHLDLVAPVF